MKKLLVLCALLLALPAALHAQPYNRAHQITASEFNSVKMPTFRKTEANRPSDTQVMALQYLLRNRGFYSAKVDGKFGTVTESAVRNFQRAKGLKEDGIVGPQTWTPLLLRLKRGDRGDAVRAAQIMLRGFVGHSGQRPFIGQETDGVLGASTRANIIKYQKGWAANGNVTLNDSLVADGVIGARTWAALLGADFGA